VTKDEQFMGGWVLEAGAMVLTNKGLLAIDEFEKMNPDDQVAMHEALEQGTISIAKASIVATLPAKTSILAGGNPKFSRFDPMRSIHEQINIPPTLLSRFDLKFTLMDVPNAKRDKMIVEHVLKSRHEAEKTTPVIPPAMIRKYVAYAKDKYKPMLSPEVSKLLKNFYVKTRGRAEGGRAPVPITLRQFEALMRISEASAKIQLSDVIRKSDADRAIKLMKASLKDLGSDVETGEIDVDKSEGGTPFSERSKITKILNIIDDLSGDKRDIVPIARLRDAAAKEGMESTEVDDLIEKLKREGILFEPNPGYVQRP
jgi:replicative DNA helicase Mcm